MMPIRMPPNTPVFSVCRPSTALVLMPRADGDDAHGRRSSPGSRPSRPAPRRRRSWRCPERRRSAKIRPSARRWGRRSPAGSAGRCRRASRRCPAASGIADHDVGRGGPGRRPRRRRRHAVDGAVPEVDGLLLVVADERAADAEQDAGDRQHGHRQHQRLAELLQEAEEVAPDLLQRLFGAGWAGSGRRGLADCRVVIGFLPRTPSGGHGSVVVVVVGRHEGADRGGGVLGEGAGGQFLAVRERQQADLRLDGRGWPGR